MPDTRYIAAGWRCEPSEARAPLVEVLRFAVGAIATTEIPVGSNSGPMVNLWLRAAGLSPGQPWCASFVSAAYARMEQPAMPRLGSAYKIHAWAKANGRLLAPGAPLLPGDICGLFHDDNPATAKREDFSGHVGLVAGVLPTGQLATIEGNVGSAVRGKVHPRSAWQWFVRPLVLM